MTVSLPDAVVWEAPDGDAPARRASQRSYSAVARKAKEEWLTLFSDDAVLDTVLRSGGVDPSSVHRVTIGFNAGADLAAGKLDAASAFCAESVAALGATPDPNRACYVYVYAARVAAARKQQAAAADWLARAQTALGGVTRDKAVASGYVGWAAAHVALSAGRKEEALEHASKARAALAAHGKSASYVVADLEQLQ